MRTGLDVFLDDPSRFRGARVGLCCNHTAVTAQLQPALPALQAAGLDVRRVFGPEHGVESTAQDMIGVDDQEGVTTPEVDVVSLYGETEESLHPTAEQMGDLDVLLFDIQDIGSRYYTYQATLGYMMEVAEVTGTRIVVLDRPNPIDGLSVEGNVVAAGFESFVSAYPLATRHGMTMGELGTFFSKVLGLGASFEVVGCTGWKRHQTYEETGLDWVYPSPNMPTVECAAIYPGMCLIEGTNLSEGRGTTRPFHLVGAPWMDRDRFVRYARIGAEESGLRGVGFRPATFLPQFQKHAGEVCHGLEIVVRERGAVHALMLGMVVLQAALRAAPDQFAWRTETYEFVDEPIAIDLLFGSAEGRTGLEARMSPRELLEAWEGARGDWDDQRESCLLY